MRRRKLQNLSIRILEKILEKSSILTNIYIAIFTKMTLNEFAMAKIPDRANVLVIGSGSVPHTLIIIGEKTNWNVVGIDREMRAVNKGKLMIERFGLQDNVKVKYGDGLTINLEGYDLIVIAYGVEPKEKLVERILKDKDQQAGLIYRTTWKIMDSIYGKEWSPKENMIKKEYNRPDFVRSILIEGGIL